jgi:two-component system sensor histidine kinase/response regulator
MIPSETGHRVLVVEDEAAMRELLASALRSRGHAVTACADAEAGWRAYEAQPYPMVVLDWMLPGIQGEELCRSMRAHPAGAGSVILMVTLRQAPGDLEAILQAGADDYLAKPITFDELGVRLAVVERQVARVLQDITERTRVEQESREAKEAAEAANRAKSEFLATVSHELRTPLHAVMGLMEIVLYAPELPEALRAHLDQASGAARILRRHIDDLLDASRLEYGRLPLVAAPFDLESCVREVLEMLAAKAESKGLELTLRFGTGTPRAVIGDAQRIRQVVTNLVDNAIRFTNAGHVLVEVRGHAFGPRRAVFRIEVEDTGVGVPEAQRARIFEKFAQANGSLTRTRDGLGLGLALAREIVELMGGGIELESTSGAGSRFAVMLALPIDQQAINEADDKTNLLRDARVLIVEDKALSAEVMHEYMLGWHMRDGIARSGEEALRMLRRAHEEGDPYRFGIIATPLPDMPVAELVGHLRPDPGLRDTLLLLLSPAGGVSVRLPTPELPVVGCLNRPLSPSPLMDAMVTVWAAWAERTGPGRAALLSAPRSEALDGRRVLLVEDNDLVRRTVAGMLTRLNCRVEEAENGAVGVAKAAGADFDIVFMDLQMPLTDGFAATEQIRALAGARGSVPIVALTAHAGAADRNRCTEAGMDGHIAKPADMDDLRRGLERWARKLVAPAADAQAGAPPSGADRKGE